MGNPDFDGKHDIDSPIDNTIFGVRGWSLQLSDNQIVLHGVQSHWPDATLISHCVKCGNKPSAKCQCGIYSYFSPAEISQVMGYVGHGSNMYPYVVGVVSNYGKVVIGNLGCRAGMSRIVALCLVNSDSPLYNIDNITAALSARYSVPVFKDIKTMFLEFPLSSDYYVPDTSFDDIEDLITQLDNGTYTTSYYGQTGTQKLSKIADGCYGRTANSRAFIVKHNDILLYVDGQGNSRLVSTHAFVQYYRTMSTQVQVNDIDSVLRPWTPVQLGSDGLPPPGAYSRAVNNRRIYITYDAPSTFTYYDTRGRDNKLTRNGFLKKFNDGQAPFNVPLQ